MTLSIAAHRFLAYGRISVRDSKYAMVVKIQIVQEEHSIIAHYLLETHIPQSVKDILGFHNGRVARLADHVHEDRSG
jgi:hypothetical protein